MYITWIYNKIFTFWWTFFLGRIQRIQDDSADCRRLRFFKNYKILKLISTIEFQRNFFWCKEFIKFELCTFSKLSSAEREIDLRCRNSKIGWILSIDIRDKFTIFHVLLALANKKLKNFFVFVFILKIAYQNCEDISCQHYVSRSQRKQVGIKIQVKLFFSFFRIR